MSASARRLLMAANVSAPAAVASPTDYANLTRWVDASDASTITDTAGAVSAWNDKSGNGYHLTTNYNGTPTTGIRTINSLNAIDYDGDDVSGDDRHAGLSTDGVTIFAVIDVDGDGAIYAEGNTANNSDLIILRVLSSVASFAVRDGTSTVQIVMNGTTNIASGVHLLTAVVEASGGACELRVDGSVEASLVSYSGISTLSLDVGATGYFVRFTDNSPFNGGIGEIVSYERALNSTEVDALESYLADKWGITL